MKFKKDQIKKIIKEELKAVAINEGVLTNDPAHERLIAYRIHEVMGEINDIVERWDDNHPYTQEMLQFVKTWTE